MSQSNGFNLERNLPHQDNAVNSILHIFTNASVEHKDNKLKDVINPAIVLPTSEYNNNIIGIQIHNQIDSSDRQFRNSRSNILDVSMETGTGKTYVYTKTIFELNSNFGIYKFIVIVPSVSIRAGTMNFLRSEASKDHFKQKYKKEIRAFVLEGKKATKSKKKFMPQAVMDFVRAQDDGQYINVLVVNQGMLNSSTMEEKFDQTLFDKYNNPFDAIASVRPFTIIDEPHRFKEKNKTWKKIEQFHSQYIIRYGATFDEYKNLIYELTAVDAFNLDLVKGITTYVEKFEAGNNINLKLINTDGREAEFELSDNGRKYRRKLAKGDSLSVLHDEMFGLSIEALNKTQVILTNGLQLIKGDTINPYSYSESLRDRMLQQAINNHFELEKHLLTREVKIKPLTLFFIDDIKGYRDGDNLSGSLKEKVESLILVNAKKLLKTETNLFYKGYLEKTIQEVSNTHGGYFSQDNTETDAKIEKEVEEILHDKEALLSLDNPRRFIFSKWTLREGWDNPNVFQICKLRSSGSENSKLQEVGRGLRLPVNEYMNRVKDETFYLNYYVDFTEQDFAKSLIGEINTKSRAFTDEVIIEKVDEAIIAKILSAYPQYKSDEEIYELLDIKGAIKRNNEFKDGGLEIFKSLFGKIFENGLRKDKIRDGNKKSHKVAVRIGKYDELKSLWEAINQQVILEYKFQDEGQFKGLLKSYFLENCNQFKHQGVRTTTQTLKIEGTKAVLEDEELLNHEITPFSMMNYSDFLSELSQKLMIKRKSLHEVFIEIQKTIDINEYLSQQTIRIIRAGFSRHLLYNALNKFQIGYKKVTNEIHPTAFTDQAGNPLKEIDSANLGTMKDDIEPNSKYFLEEIFYDSKLEHENILKKIKGVIVYTKIPKRSIRIPVAGGGTYSPDFAYVVERMNGTKHLNLIIETKGKFEDKLEKDEKQKIKHAEYLFNELNKNNKINIQFAVQFNSEDISDLIQRYL